MGKIEEADILLKRQKELKKKLNVILQEYKELSVKVEALAKF